MQELPLCEAGHVMELTEGSENQAWFCNFCKRNSWDFEQKVQAWRCPQDIRDFEAHIHVSTGCDYDICTQCIKEYRVRL